MWPDAKVMSTYRCGCMDELNLGDLIMWLSMDVNGCNECGDCGVLLRSF
jgi:hypothetical protein